MNTILLALGLLITDPITVSFYGEGCKFEASYAAEQVHISKEGVITVFFEDGSRLDVPLKYTEEAQVRLHAFIRSYSWENGRVVERKIPKCGGSV